MTKELTPSQKKYRSRKKAREDKKLIAEMKETERLRRIMAKPISDNANYYYWLKKQWGERQIESECSFEGTYDLLK